MPGENVKVVIATVPSNYVRPSLIGKSAEEYQEVLKLIQDGKYEEAYSLGKKILSNTSPVIKRQKLKILLYER
jgi:hypothetical protein